LTPGSGARHEVGGVICGAAAAIRGEARPKK